DIVADAAIEDVVAGPAIDIVVAAIAIDRVDPGIARKRIVIGIAVNSIGVDIADGVARGGADNGRLHNTVLRIAVAIRRDNREVLVDRDAGAGTANGEGAKIERLRLIAVMLD